MAVFNEKKHYPGEITYIAFDYGFLTDPHESSAWWF